MTDETKDFTPHQAISWIKTVSDRLTTAEQIAERLEQEAMMLAIMNNKANLEHFPNIVQARKDLIDLLNAKLARLERLKSFSVIKGGKD